MSSAAPTSAAASAAAASTLAALTLAAATAAAAASQEPRHITVRKIVSALANAALARAQEGLESIAARETRERQDGSVRVRTAVSAKLSEWALFAPAGVAPRVGTVARIIWAQVPYSDCSTEHPEQIIETITSVPGLALSISEDPGVEEHAYFLGDYAVCVVKRDGSAVLHTLPDEKLVLPPNVTRA